MTTQHILTLVTVVARAEQFSAPRAIADTLSDFFGSPVQVHVVVSGPLWGSDKLRLELLASWNDDPSLSLSDEDESYLWETARVRVSDHRMPHYRPDPGAPKAPHMICRW
jgi:hypothetical protein